MSVVLLCGRGIPACRRVLIDRTQSSRRTTPAEGSGGSCCEEYVFVYLSRPYDTRNKNSLLCEVDALLCSIYMYIYIIHVYVIIVNGLNHSPRGGGGRNEQNCAVESQRFNAAVRPVANGPPAKTLLEEASHIHAMRCACGVLVVDGCGRCRRGGGRCSELHFL